MSDPVGPRSRPWVQAIGLVVLVVLAIVGVVITVRWINAAASAAPTRAVDATPASTIIAAAPMSPTGATVKARVIRVVDGDTIVVDIGGSPHRVRYIGMDTPESVKPDTPVEPMAKEATAANRRLVDGRSVVLERDVSETDRFGRLLRNVWVERDGGLVLVGLELVREGFAQVSTFPPDVRYVDALLEAQAAARDDGLGLWGEP